MAWKCGRCGKDVVPANMADLCWDCYKLIYEKKEESK